jgi:hypothetical protein
MSTSLRRSLIGYASMTMLHRPCIKYNIITEVCHTKTLYHQDDLGTMDLAQFESERRISRKAAALVFAGFSLCLVLDFCNLTAVAIFHTRSDHLRRYARHTSSLTLFFHPKAGMTAVCVLLQERTHMRSRLQCALCFIEVRNCVAVCVTVVTTDCAV